MKQHPAFQYFAFLILVGFLLTSCSASQPAITSTPTFTPTTASTPTATVSPTPAFPLPEGLIIFQKSQDKKFTGSVHGQGETAIIMANMTTGGETEWEPFVQAVDKQKFTVITFNYSQSDFPGASQDTAFVLKQFRNSGYRRVICIGASLGVTACASIASEPEMIGIVLIAGPNYGGSLADLTYPKLFIAGEDDPWATNTRMAYDLADDPKTLVLFPNNGIHGANLFYSADREEFLGLLIEFVENLP